MKKKTLYLLMQEYPVANSETTFVEPEIPYLKENFDLTVVPLEKVSHSPLSKMVSLVKAVLSPMPYKAAAEGAELGKNPFMVFAFSVFMLHRAKMYADYLRKNVFLERDAVVYSYWYNEIALSGLLLKDKFPGYKFITRCHGYDVYDYRVPGGYHPYKEYMDSRLDKVVFISKMQREYYIERYSKADWDKYVTSYLGVAPQQQKPAANGEVLNIVSCSHIIPLKRLDLLIDALSQITEFKLCWHHFGEGEDGEKIKKLAQDKLGGSNIEYKFHGFVPNREYIEFLNNNPADLFITTSSTEGLPVSIMEAAAQGIPCIATDVGGIKEIVGEDSGFLMSDNPTETQVAQAIKNFYNLTAKQKTEKGAAAYRKWRENFNCEINSQNMVNMINKL